MERFDFIIQIIGAPESGKSTIAHMIQEVLSNNRIKVSNADCPHDQEDYVDVMNKSALILSFRTQEDPQIKGCE